MLCEDERRALMGIVERLDDEDREAVLQGLLGGELLTVRQVARNLNLNPESIRRACRAKRIPHKLWNRITGKRNTGEYRFSPADVRRIRGMMTVREEGGMSGEMCIKGVDAICKAVGENKNNFNALVENEGLPAWRRDENGTWRALRDDLHEWLKEQSKKYGKTG